MEYGGVPSSTSGSNVGQAGGCDSRPPVPCAPSVAKALARFLRIRHLGGRRRIFRYWPSPTPPRESNRRASPLEHLRTTHARPRGRPSHFTTVLETAAFGTGGLAVSSTSRKSSSTASTWVGATSEGRTELRTRHSTAGRADMGGRGRVLWVGARNPRNDFCCRHRFTGKSSVVNPCAPPRHPRPFRQRSEKVAKSCFHCVFMAAGHARRLPRWAHVGARPDLFSCTQFRRQTGANGA
ncbi:hypothetical protein LXA43DRAFT_122437 [Ganoderma leucocontextum]|nr:hypothetical protein LXA43DRAFT_122437 [Ganoderma leucocontextum]